VEATPARFHQETVAARRMLEQVEKLGLRPQSLRAHKGYGSGEFLAWLVNRGIQPHIPVIDRRHQTKGYFTQEHFRYEPTENAYYCPEGKPLRYIGPARASQGNIYRSTKAQCRGCPQKERCTSSTCRKVLVSWYEPEREIVRSLVGTPRTSVRTVHAIKSKLCLQNSSNACAWSECVSAASGMSPSSFN
jgi:hypothetical protein